MIPNIKDSQFLLLSGPCAVESKELLDIVAQTIKTICNKHNVAYVFKSSYKKANRSRIDSFTGIGDEKALGYLRDVRSEQNLPVVTDVHSPEEAKRAAEYVDVLQIPAFLCRQTDLLVAAGETGKIVNIKKGQFLSPEAMKFAIEKVQQTGNQNVWVTERGTTFGYGDLVVDFRSIPKMKDLGVPVILDCTHALQQPNRASGVTGGQPAFIEMLAKAGIAAGVDGLFIETHPKPSEALSDGANMLPLDQMEALIEKCVRIKQAIS